MSLPLTRLTPRTIRGQITLIIFIAAAAVIMIGRGFEQVRHGGYVNVHDTDTIIARAGTFATLLRDQNYEGRRALVARAGDLELDLMLLDEAALELMTASATPESSIERAVAWLFPPDRDPPPGSRRVFVEGGPALMMPVDEETVLLVRNMPAATNSSDFIGPLSYYILAVATLLLCFSIYAARTVTAPLARIAKELNRADGVSEDTRFSETGTSEVISLAKALNGMRTRISEMLDTRTRMLRRVSHDLRTPLTRLRLRTERLEDAELREMMTADIDHINALVNETLDYLRTDASGEELERTDIASLMQTIQANFVDVGFAVTYDGPDRLIGRCKPIALTRAVTNLCDNALKFGSRADITLALMDKMIRIDVADDGPGISADQRAKVLEPFFKIDAARSTAKNSGFGLGLSIVSDILRAHGGHLEFHDNHPRGLIARLLLPSL